MPPTSLQALQAELKRLKAKRSAVDDADLRDALALKIREIEAQIEALAAETPAPEPEPEEDPAEEAPPLTPQLLDQLEKLMREVQVAKMRGQKQEIARLWEEAVRLAPQAPHVLELRGDHLMETGHLKEAIAMYKRAVKHDPKNVALERKYAAGVLRSESALSVEDSLRAGLGGRGPSTENAVGAKSAVLLSVMIPGCGQIVRGETLLGGALLGGWLLSILGVSLLYRDFAGLVSMAGLGNAPPPKSLLVLLPLATGAICHFSAIFQAMSRVKEEEKPKSVERPQPPVDLPY